MGVSLGVVIVCNHLTNIPLHVTLVTGHRCRAAWFLLSRQTQTWDLGTITNQNTDSSASLSRLFCHGPLWLTGDYFTPKGCTGKELVNSLVCGCSSKTKTKAVVFPYRVKAISVYSFQYIFDISWCSVIIVAPRESGRSSLVCR